MALVAMDDVVPRGIGDDVVTRAAENPVVACAAFQPVVAAVAVKRVVADARDDSVVPVVPPRTTWSPPV